MGGGRDPGGHMTEVTGDFPALGFQNNGPLTFEGELVDGLILVDFNAEFGLSHPAVFPRLVEDGADAIRGAVFVVGIFPDAELLDEAVHEVFDGGGVFRAKRTQFAMQSGDTGGTFIFVGNGIPDIFNQVKHPQRTGVEEVFEQFFPRRGDGFSREARGVHIGVNASDGGDFGGRLGHGELSEKIHVGLFFLDIPNEAGFGEFGFRRFEEGF